MTTDQAVEALPEPLFLLHTGDDYGNEQGEWETEANSSMAVDALCGQHVAQTIGLYDEHTIRRLLAAERERALEDAARLADAWPSYKAAAKIRALKAKKEDHD